MKIEVEHGEKRGGHHAPFEGNAPGEVELTPLGGAPHPDGLHMLRVAFPKDTRTARHSHQGGQLIYVGAGEAMVWAEGEAEPLRLASGEAYWTQGGVAHWHGASDRSEAVLFVANLGPTDWSKAADPEA